MDGLTAGFGRARGPQPVLVGASTNSAMVAQTKSLRSFRASICQLRVGFGLLGPDSDGHFRHAGAGLTQKVE